MSDCADESLAHVPDPIDGADRQSEYRNLQSWCLGTSGDPQVPKGVPPMDAATAPRTTSLDGATGVVGAPGCDREPRTR
ncbi:hypothetical protein SAMN06272737_101245 [Blastococcus mobilis]|uniref:Uncharacterized protein n=1 Tax=Blastococcus mobilis TaxID=1938746 RepID=A0A238UQD8_9ACTN|nr:hypothetical protein SAMN06272737_101245 [Blastococcus mobilis]